MSSERALWLWLKPRLPLAGHYTRIESEISPGFPDIHYTFAGISGTLELKCSYYPKAKFPFKSIGIRKSQIDWIRDELSAGGIVWLMLQVGSERMLLSGAWASHVNNFTLRQLHNYSVLTYYPGVGKNWDRHKLIDYLCKKP